jgi:nicotinamidase/pyrazinamidase
MKSSINPNRKDALLVTDIQIDFLPGGALPVESSDKIIPVANEYIARFAKAGAHIIASRDWHPANHISFTQQGGPWPPHCIAETAGAKFSPDLKLPAQTLIISKATEPDHEAYSAFDHTPLESELRKLSVEHLYVAGLATDYCVVNTVLDGLCLGFAVTVLMDASLGIDVHPGDVVQAVAAMKESGAVLATDADFSNPSDDLPTDIVQADRLTRESRLRLAAKEKARMRSKGADRQIKRER